MQTQHCLAHRANVSRQRTDPLDNSLCSTLCGSTCRGSQYPHKGPLEEVLKQLPTNGEAERRFNATREKRLTHLSMQLGVSMSLQVGSNCHKKTGRAEDVAQWIECLPSMLRDPGSIPRTTHIYKSKLGMVAHTCNPST